MEIFINFPRDDAERTCSRFLLRLQEVVVAEDEFISKMSSFIV
jgi:hypothetical protein